MRNNKLKLVISILVSVSIILVACIVIILIGKKSLDEKNEQISTLEYEIEANKQIVYVASQDICAGETIAEGKNVFKQEIFTGLESDYYMPEEMVGGIAVLDIPALQPIMNNMVTALEITQDTREYEIVVANLMTDQKENDYVDIRIMFPDGTDYLVLSKKNVMNLSLTGALFYTYLSEDEILRLASATIDAYTVTGSYIYTVRYVEESLQEEPIPTYIVRPEVLDLINADPNVLEQAKSTLNLQARLALEQRLLGLSEDALSAVAEGHQIQDTAKSSVIVGTEYTDNGNYTEAGSTEENAEAEWYNEGVPVTGSTDTSTDAAADTTAQ